eukprot:7355771-Alexandrium_andersonii.AAC.1
MGVGEGRKSCGQQTTCPVASKRFPSLRGRLSASKPPALRSGATVPARNTPYWLRWCAQDAPIEASKPPALRSGAAVPARSSPYWLRWCARHARVEGIRGGSGTLGEEGWGWVDISLHGATGGPSKLLGTP